MTPHLQTDRVRLFHGDCREVLATLPDASVDSVVTDPPYELGFMGKAWDGSGVAYDVDLWAEVLRVIKPGGHLMAFGGTRTYHRMAVAIEDAGFEVRDSIHWLYGSGFPKSLDVSKAIDKAAGAEREVVGRDGGSANESWLGTAKRGETGFGIGKWDITAPATPEAAEWEGWGTALKPAHEPVVVARKPLAGTVAANVLAHGTGALNVDGCRVRNIGAPIARVTGAGILGGTSDGWESPWKSDPDAVARRQERADAAIDKANTLGRWPANVVLDPEAAEVLDRQSGDDEAGASRFFTVAGFSDDDLTSFRYVAKPDRAERNAGLDGLPEKVTNTDTPPGTLGSNSPRAGANRNGAAQNFHPTVKPLDLMRWLVRLVTPPGGTVLEPFAGSGTTLAAAVLEGFDAVGIELTADYLPLIEGRVRWSEAEARFGPVTGPTKVRKDAGAPTLFDEEASA